MLDATTEARIIALVRSGEKADARAAADQLVAAVSQPLYRLCLHLTGHGADAEDTMQEAMIAACRALPDFRGDAKLSTWVYRIALRDAGEIRNRRTRRDETSSEDLAQRAAHSPPVDEQAATRQRAAQLHRAMGKLNPAEREVIALFAVDGMKHPEIAALLDIPEGTVWSRLHLARKKLLALMT